MGRGDHGFIGTLKNHTMSLTNIWISFPEILLVTDLEYNSGMSV